MSRSEVYRCRQDGGGLFLNLNEGAREVPDWIKDEVLQRMKSIDWRRYPDGQMKGCRRRMAERYGLDQTSVLFGNGSNELLGASMLAFSPPGGRIFSISPGFSMVPRQAAMLGRKLVTEPCSGDDFSFPRFSGSTALHGVDMVMLASPNNPTGLCLPEVFFDELMERFAGPVVIDEAYGEFAGHSFASKLKSYPRLVILKTFSKAYSLAGGRIGYALSSPEMIERLESCTLPFSVGLFQQACIDVLSRHELCPGNRVQDVCREREKLTKALWEFTGFKVIPSRANFVLFSPGKQRSRAFKQKLDDERIWIRSFEEKALVDWFRVTIGRVGENRQFLKAVSDFVRETSG